MAYVFSKKLVEKTQNYFKERYGHEFSGEETQRVLHTLADFHQLFFEPSYEQSPSLDP
jgi:hypothetical protein